MRLRGALICAVLVTAGVLTGCDSESQSSSDEPEQTSVAEEQVARSETQEESTDETTGEETSELLACSEEAVERERIRIGDFAEPEDVPAYEVLDEEQIERDCISAVRLLVDTVSRSESDYTLIAREVKSQYEDLDAVTVEFTDTADTLSYNGSALIFNTPPGAYYMGFIYGPPNNEGYFVTAAKD